MNAALRNRNYDAAIMQADRVFYPLRSLITGEVIPGFPQTIRAISLLDGMCRQERCRCVVGER